MYQILDWDYYIERLGNTIQKIITIPAAMQGVSLIWVNSCVLIPHSPGLQSGSTCEPPRLAAQETAGEKRRMSPAEDQ